MPRALDTVIYYATAPIRLFGRSRRFRRALGAAFVIALLFTGGVWAVGHFFPSNTAKTITAKLPPLPDLPPMSRPSQVIAPVAVSLAAIQHTLDNTAPRQLAGKSDNPVASILSRADIGITVSRGAMSVSGRPNEITVVTPLSGNLKITGNLAGQAGNLAGSITGLLGSNIGKDVGKLTGKLDQNVELRGQVTVRSKPAIMANWRLDPNLAGQLNLNDSGTSIAGVRLNLANEARPFIDRTMNDQIAALQNRIRSDPFIEKAAREQWTRMCRSIPLGGAGTGLPTLWLEMKPVRAAAAQPLVDARNVTLTVGIQAETRVVPSSTKPNCPFPQQLELVPPMDNGKIAVGVPIDMPFTELNKLLEAQFKGKRFPEEKNAPVEVEVRKASLAASGDRLLIALRVKAVEKKSWFGLGAEADVAIWGKPVLDQKNQMMRLTEISVAVESEAGYGLLSAAARAAVPYLEQAVADNAVIDLKPFAADALAKIREAMGEFTRPADGVKVDATVTALRLVGIAFDAGTLRIIAEADGTVKVAVSKLP